MKLTKISEADRLSDFISEGYSADEAINRVWNNITQNKSDLKMDQVIKEFKLLYGHDPWFYEMLLTKANKESSNDVDYELLELFETKISAQSS